MVLAGTVEMRATNRMPVTRLVGILGLLAIIGGGDASRHVS